MTSLEGSYRCKTIVIINFLSSFHLNILWANENFKKQLEYFKPHIDEGLDFRMGLTFWTDRWFAANEMDVSNTFLQYKCGLPLTNISVVCIETTT